MITWCIQPPLKQQVSSHHHQNVLSLLQISLDLMADSENKFLHNYLGASVEGLGLSLKKNHDDLQCHLGIANVGLVDSCINDKGEWLVNHGYMCMLDQIRVLAVLVVCHQCRCGGEVLSSTACYAIQSRWKLPLCWCLCCKLSKCCCQWDTIITLSLPHNLGWSISAPTV